MAAPTFNKLPLLLPASGNFDNYRVFITFAVPFFVSLVIHLVNCVLSESSFPCKGRHFLF
jgi:hypothetical protein